ncbi:hypothetical protein DPMN_079929, partial [Dreissena polymorpha]
MAFQRPTTFLIETDATAVLTGRLSVKQYGPIELEWSVVSVAVWSYRSGVDGCQYSSVVLSQCVPIGLERSVVNTEVWSYRSGAVVCQYCSVVLSVWSGRLSIQQCDHIGLERSSLCSTIGHGRSVVRIAVWPYRSGAVVCQYSSVILSVWSGRLLQYGPVGLERSSQYGPIGLERSVVSIAGWSYRSGAVVCQYSRVLSIGRLSVKQYGPIGLGRSSIGRLSVKQYGPIGLGRSSVSITYGPFGLERSSVSITRSSVSITVWSYRSGACGHYGPIVKQYVWSCGSGAYGPRYGHYSSMILSVWSVWSNRSGAYGPVGLERSSVIIARSVCGPNAVGCQYSNRSSVSIARSVVTIERWFYQSGASYRSRAFYRSGAVGFQYSSRSAFSIAVVVLCVCDGVFGDGMGGYIGLGRRYCGSIASFYWSVTGGFIYNRGGLYQGGSIGGSIGLWGWPGGLSVWDSLGRWSSIHIADWFYRSQTMGGSFGCGWWSVSIARRFYLFGTSRVVLSVCDDGTLAAASGPYGPIGLERSAFSIARSSYRSIAVGCQYSNVYTRSPWCNGYGVRLATGRSRVRSPPLWSYRAELYGPIFLEWSSYRSGASYRSRACGPIGLERSFVSIARSSYRSRASYRSGYGPIGRWRLSYRSGAVGCHYSSEILSYSSISVASIARSVVSIARSVVSIARSDVSIAYSTVGCQYSSMYGPIGLERWSVSIARSLVSCGPIGLERSSVSIARSVVSIARSVVSIARSSVTIASIVNIARSVINIAVGRLSELHRSVVNIALFGTIGLEWSLVSVTRSVVRIARSSVSIAYSSRSVVSLERSSVIWSGRLSLSYSRYSSMYSSMYGPVVWSYRSGAYGPCGHIGLERSVVMWSCRSGAYGPVGLDRSSVNKAVWSNRSGAVVCQYNSMCGHYVPIGLERSSVSITSVVTIAYGPIGLERSSVSKTVWSYLSGAVGCHYSSVVMWVWSDRMSLLQYGPYSGMVMSYSSMYGPIGLERSSVIIARSVSIVCGPNAVGCQYSNVCGPIGLERSLYRSGACCPIGQERSVASIARSAFSIARSAFSIAFVWQSGVSWVYNNVCSVGLVVLVFIVTGISIGWFFVSRVVLSACDVWFYRSGT